MLLSLEVKGLYIAFPVELLIKVDAPGVPALS